MTRALVIVDVQNDFCEGGSLAVAGGAEVARAISGYLAAPEGGGYAHVVATQDYHVDPVGHFAAEPGLRRAPGRRTASPARPARTSIPALDTGQIEAVFRKGARSAAYSGFEGADEYGMPLAAWLRERGRHRGGHRRARHRPLRAGHGHRRRDGGLRDQGAAQPHRGSRRDTIKAALAEMRTAGVELAGHPVVGRRSGLAPRPRAA